MFSDRRCGFASIIVLAILAFLVGAPIAFPQALTLVQSSTRSAGNGSSGYNGDFGSATTISLGSPSYIVFDSHGNQFLSDTLNNCVRKIDTSGNVTTVAGLSAVGQGDTCNTAATSNPTAGQGLYRPTGLAIDSADRLYIADSMHNCVRALAANSTGTANLTTVAGMCSSVATDSITPQPNGIAIDAAGNLYIALQDSNSATPVNQVVRHNFGSSSISACRVAGAASTNSTANCAGVTNTVSLVRPSGLAFNINGDLYIADTGNNCVRQIVGLAAGSATVATAVGQCLNDGSGSSSTAVRNPYGIAISPMQSVFISESNPDNIVSFVPGSRTLKLVGGLPSGAAGTYDSTQDGKSALNTPLNNPRGLAFDTLARLFVADSQNSITRELSSNLLFPRTPVGSPSATQSITFAINQAVNLTTTIGSDYSITSTTCSGALVAAVSGSVPNTCQVFVRFTPVRPGMRRSPLKVTDSNSDTSIFAGLQAVGTGALNVFTPGTTTTVASNLASPSTVTTDAAGNAYVLESVYGSSQIRLIPAGGGTPSVLLALSSIRPTAIAADAAGNWFVAYAANGTVSRFGADGSINTSYITGLDTPVALHVDLFDNLYIVQAGTTNNIILAYATGDRKVIAGGGSNSTADGVTATSAAFVSPNALTVDLNGVLYVADQGGHRIYAVDNSGIIHTVAGNGSTATTTPGQATGTAILAPTSLAIDAAGDLYIADQSTGIIYIVYKSSSNGSNIATVLNISNPPTPNGPINIALDGSSNLFVSRNATNSVLELAYAKPTLDFGSLQAGVTSSVKLQTISNVGTDNLDITSPYSTTDSHFTIDSGSTTCGTTILAGSACAIGFTFAPTANSSYSATSIISSNSYNTPQPINLVGTGKQISTLTFTLPAESEVYGKPFAAIAAFTGATTTPTGTLIFTARGQTLCTVSGTLAANTTCNAPASGMGVGTYTVTFNYSGDSNYSPAAGVTALTVSPAPLTEAVNNAARVYGAANPTFAGALTGVISGETVLVSFSTAATANSAAGTYPIIATLTAVGATSLANYAATIEPGVLTVAPSSTTLGITTSAKTVSAGTNVTFTAKVTASSGMADGTVSFFDGTVLLGNAVLGSDGTATLKSSTLSVGDHAISASFQGNTNFSTSSGAVSQSITHATGSFTVLAGTDTTIIRGTGSAVYQITVNSVGSFAGQVALSCSGLPAGATCSFAIPAVNLTSGNSVTTAMTVTYSSADAKLQAIADRSPLAAGQDNMTPLTAAAIFPAELTGLGVLFAGIRRRKILGTQKMRLLLMIVFTLGILGLMGCGISSTAFKTYTINITGTSITFPAPAQTTSVILSVGQQ